jgi:hypothetical protein
MQISAVCSAEVFGESMKSNGLIIGGIVVGIALLTAIAVFPGSERVAVVPESPSAGGRELPNNRAENSARTTEQIDQLQRSVLELKSQLAAARQSPPKDVISAQPPQSLEERRAADAERYREYMDGAAQDFNKEKVDASWAARASSRVSATFANDEALQNLQARVECRSHTCRVQIPDDGTGIVSKRIPQITRAVADVLPATAAEYVDQGNGQSMVVLYMYSQPFGGPARNQSVPDTR